MQECVVNAAAGGLEGLKLYGMVGLPGEGEEDVQATVDMMSTVRACQQQQHFSRVVLLVSSSSISHMLNSNIFSAMDTQLRAKAPGLKLTLGCSTFVPKSHTPFQWRGVDKAADARLATLDKAMVCGLCAHMHVPCVGICVCLSCMYTA